VFKTRSRDEWCELMEGTDVCFAPVLDIREAPKHPHNQARETYIEIGGMTQPAPAPRFSRTSPEVNFAPHLPGSDKESVLAEWGVKV
jgi:alpha-methylacyl-CoA racemase